MPYSFRRTHLRLFIAVVLPMALSALPARGSVTTVGKGQNLMVNWGLQFNGLVAVTSDPFNLNTLKGANFNSPFWAWTADVSKLGAAPGSTWSPLHQRFSRSAAVILAPSSSAPARRPSATNNSGRSWCVPIKFRN